MFATKSGTSSFWATDSRDLCERLHVSDRRLSFRLTHPRLAKIARVPRWILTRASTARRSSTDVCAHHSKAQAWPGAASVRPQMCMAPRWAG
jgi:hypothetical protein